MPDGSRAVWRVAAALVLVVDGLDALALGRYRITATADGQILRFLGHEGTSVEALEFGFQPVQMYPYGIRVRQLEVVDASWSG